MKLLIISPGKAHTPELRDAIGEYEKRLKSAISLEWVFPAVGTKESEGTVILKLIRPEDHIILLDERGKDISSTGLAEVVETQMNAGTKRLVFIIGGAFGVSEEVKERANVIIRLSAMVFPHMLVRLILIEQLYRAWSIRTGGKYHHE